MSANNMSTFVQVYNLFPSHRFLVWSHNDTVIKMINVFLRTFSIIRIDEECSICSKLL